MERATQQTTGSKCRQGRCSGEEIESQRHGWVDISPTPCPWSCRRRSSRCKLAKCAATTKEVASNAVGGINCPTQLARFAGPPRVSRTRGNAGGRCKRASLREPCWSRLRAPRGLPFKVGVTFVAFEARNRGENGGCWWGLSVSCEHVARTVFLASASIPTPGLPMSHRVSYDSPVLSHLRLYLIRPAPNVRRAHNYASLSFVQLALP